MKNSLATWGLVLALILFSGIASVIVPNLMKSNTQSSGSVTSEGFSLPTFDLSVKNVTLPEGLPAVGGKSYPDVLVFGGIAAVFMGAILAMGVPLALIYAGLDKVASSNKGDKKYEQGVATLQKKQQTLLKEYGKIQPAQPAPADPSTPQVTWLITTLLMMFLLGIFGVLFSANFAGRENLPMWGLGFALVGLLFRLVPVAMTRFFNDPKQAATDTSTLPVDWGMVWAVVTGAILLGIGIGILMWTRQAPCVGPNC